MDTTFNLQSEIRDLRFEKKNPTPRSDCRAASSMFTVDYCGGQ